jgi:hypothetical protein
MTANGVAQEAMPGGSSRSNGGTSGSDGPQLALASTGGSCSSIQGCQSGNNVIQLKDNKGSCKQTEQINQQFAEEFNKAMAQCMKDMGCSSTTPAIGSMGIGRDKGAKGGGGRSANSCHKTRRAIDIGSFECGGRKFVVKEGSKKDNEHSRFFRRLEACLKGGKVTTILYDGGAHEDHLHVQLKGCSGQNNSSGGQCSPSGGGTTAVADAGMPAQWRQFSYFFSLVFAASPAVAADAHEGEEMAAVKPRPNILLSKQDGERGWIRVTETDWGEPSDYPYQVKVSCRHGSEKTVFDKKVCKFTDRGYDVKTGRLWIMYAMPVNTDDGLTRCGGIYYESFEFGDGCRMKAQKSEFAGISEKYPAY